VAVTRSGEQRFLVFNAPTLLEAIRGAFFENTYGDTIRELSEWEHSLRLQCGDRGTSDIDRWQMHFLKLNPISPKFYHLPETCFGRGDNPPEVEARLQDVLVNGADYSEVLSGRAFLRPVPYSDKEAFENLFKHLDADFLLRGLDTNARVALDGATQGWGLAVEQLLNRDYWLKGKLKLDEVKKLVKSSLKEKYFENIGDVQTWVEEARITFIADRRYVLRGTIENMQRLVLGGHGPFAVYVENLSHIDARWRTLLRTTLNARLSRDEGQMQEVIMPMSEIEAFGGSTSGSGTEAAELNEICDAIEELLKASPSETAFAVFHECARECGDDLWNDAVGFTEERFGPDFKKCIFEAVESCRKYDRRDPHFSGLSVTVFKAFQQFV
jgi:hypothetical protein